MTSVLQECVKNQAVASLYFDRNEPFSHLTGRVLQANENELLVAHISAHGCYDGFILKRVDDLYRIDTDGKYEQKIEQLYSKKRQSHPSICFNVPNRSLYELLVEYAKQENLIVSVEFDDACLSGFVASVTPEAMELRIVDEYGAACGMAYFYISEVSTISVDTDDEQDIRLLAGTS